MFNGLAPAAGGGGFFGSASMTPTTNTNSDVNRTWLSRFLMADTGTATKLTLRKYTGSVTGDTIKALIYGGGTASVPGTLVAVGTATAVGAGTSGDFDALITASLSPGYYWIGYVAQSFQSVFGAVVATNNEILYNGTTPYSAPPTTLPSTIDGTYNLQLCARITYTIP